MNIFTNQSLQLRTIIVVVIVSLFFGQNTAQALPRRHPATPPARHARVITHLPAGYLALQLAGALFYYSHGVFYKKGSSGYVVVNAPIGVTIPSLHPGYTTLLTGGNRIYFVNDSTYYQKVPAGYIVVVPPPAVVMQPPIFSTGKVVVTAKILNVRSIPGVEHQVITQVTQGMLLQVMGNAPDWYYVQLPNGTLGWVMKDFTDQQPLPADG